MRILLVEDNADIVRTLTELLRSEGYDVEATPSQNGAIALGTRVEKPFDLVLLDVTLEQGNGFAVCGALKEARPHLPVVFLTASDDEFNTVAGLSMGADDYIAKPFRPRELLARVAAAIRRSQPKVARLTLGDVVIDPDRAHVEKGGREVVLSALEYRLLLLFAKNKDRVVTRDMMREALWEDSGAYVEENTLSVYIRRLRDKIEDDPANPQLIRTVRGMGYRAAE